jgi:hypothetical protein
VASLRGDQDIIRDEACKRPTSWTRNNRTAGSCGPHLSSDREANNIVVAVLDATVGEITENINTNGFTLKLPSFGKFEVRHK